MDTSSSTVLLVLLSLVLLACHPAGRQVVGLSSSGIITSSQKEAAAEAPCCRFEVCLKGAGKSPFQAVFPGGDDNRTALYDQARRVILSTTLARPAAVFYAYSTADVSAAVQCAFQAGVKVAPACGRQGFTGRAVQDNYLTVDVTNMTQKKLYPKAGTVMIGAGNSNAMVAAFLQDSKIQGVALPAGVCTWVGMSGWLLGGGIGPLGRYAGLGCDSVTEIEVVLSNSTVVRANAGRNTDLFWASCGGGGGTFGIVTSFTLKLISLPNDGHMTSVDLTYKAGVETTVQEFMRFQRWLPSMSRRFGLDKLHLGSGSSGSQFSVGGVFLGTAEEALKGLDDAGMLNSNLDNSSYTRAIGNEAWDRYPYSGLKINMLDSIYDWYFQEAPTYTGNSSAPFALTGLPASWQARGFSGTKEEVKFLSDLLRGQGRQVVGGMGYFTGAGHVQSRLTGLQPQHNVLAIAKYMEEAREACMNGTQPFLCHLLLGYHVLGGAYADRAPNATAYPWRKKYLLLASALWPPASAMKGASPKAIKDAAGFVERFPSLLHDAESAYVNYQAPTLPNWEHAYFGDNYARLQKIKSKWDPNDIFGKPYTVKPVGMPAMTWKDLTFYIAGVDKMDV